VVQKKPFTLDVIREVTANARSKWVVTCTNEDVRNIVSKIKAAAKDRKDEVAVYISKNSDMEYILLHFKTKGFDIELEQTFFTVHCLHISWEKK